MTDHDREMQRRLDGLETPDHRSGFWDDVRAANSTREASDTDAYFVENRDAGLVVLDDRRSRRRVSRRLLAAAAVVLLAMVGAGVVLARDEGSSLDVATDPNDPTRPDGDDGDGDEVMTAPVGPLEPEGDPIERGSGRVVAVDPAGEFLYVADDGPEGGFGCEAGPSRALFVEPVDGGERKPVLPPELNDASGGVDVRFGPDGAIAVHTYCEGSTTALVTGTMGNDGRVVDPTESEITDLDLGRPVDWIVDLEFRTAGEQTGPPARPLPGLVVTTYSRTEDGSDHRHLYELYLGATHMAADLGPDDVVHLDVTAAGRLATISTSGELRFHREPVVDVGDASGLDVSPSGDRVVVTGDGRLTAIDPESGAATVVAETDANLGEAVVPNDGTVVYMTFRIDPGSGTETSVIRSAALDAGSESTVLAEVDTYTRFAVTDDLSRLFYSRSNPNGGEQTIWEQPLSR